MDNMKKIRKKAGITQAELAKIMGVTQGTVAMWETGRANPVADKLPALAKTLGCTIDDLFEKEESGMKVRDFIKVFNESVSTSGNIGFFFYDDEAMFASGCFSYRKSHYYDMRNGGIWEMADGKFGNAEIKEISMNGMNGTLAIKAIMEE